MRQHVPLEALYLVVGGLIVPPKRNAVCTAAILDFMSCPHHYKGVKPFQKGVSEGTTLSALEFFFLPTSCHGYFSLSVKIIADESTFFLCMLGLHPTPTNIFEMWNSQNWKNTFLTMSSSPRSVKTHL